MRDGDDRQESSGVTAVYRRGRRVLIVLGAMHMVLAGSSCGLFFWMNLNPGETFDQESMGYVMLNSAVIGLVGSLLYFSRKSYVYLITDKFGRIIVENGFGIEAVEEGTVRFIDLDKYKTILSGYYLYLAARPWAGVVIGPVLTMIVLAGLTTFSTFEADGGVVLSEAGTYLLYVFSFVGGYSSSEPFDYFSKLAGNLIERIEIR